MRRRRNYGNWMIASALVGLFSKKMSERGTPTKVQALENAKTGEERANAKILQIEKEARERTEYWEKTGLPFDKWK